MARNLPKCLQTGLVMWLNSSGIDISGNNNNGTLNGSPTKVRRLQNDGLSYNGTNQIVSISNFSRPVNISTFCWIKTTNTTGVQNPISGDDSTVGNLQRSFQLRTEQTTGKAGAIVFNASSNNFITSNTNVCTGNYFFIGFTYDGVSTKLYVNGILETTNTVLTGDMRSGTGIAIGQISDENAYQLFNGNIINPMIWNRALSATEVQLLHKATFIK